jgi:hypothetical protein
MIVNRRKSAPLDQQASEKIFATIDTTLQNITTVNNRFIINDTPWYTWRRKGGLSPCVVNSASYISKTFQANLALHNGWEGETKIDNQDFDGFGVVDYQGTTYTISESVIVEFIKSYLEETKQPEYLISKFFSIFFGMYVKRQMFNLDGIPDTLHHYFTENDGGGSLRVGVEFETGNIGSSFRAILKLNNLFLKNHIDVGAFITSVDKENCAARIWPSSNRNGSFAELENRNYFDNVNLPLFELGFSPDEYSDTAPYLGENKKTFIPVVTNEVVESKGKNYQVYIGANNDRILRLIT